MLLPALVLAVTPLFTDEGEMRRLRLEPRFRIDISGLGNVRASAPGVGGGVGASLLAGFVFDDVWLPVVHAEATVFFGSRFLVSAGGGVERVLSEHVSLGVGLEFTAWVTASPGSTDRFMGATFPVRLRYTPVVRAAAEVERSGLVFGLAVAPGFTEELLPSAPGNRLPRGFGLSVGVTVGIASW